MQKQVNFELESFFTFQRTPQTISWFRRRVLLQQLLLLDKIFCHKLQRINLQTVNNTALNMLWCQLEFTSYQL